MIKTNKKLMCFGILLAFLTLTVKINAGTIVDGKTVLNGDSLDVSGDAIITGNITASGSVTADEFVGTGSGASEFYDGVTVGENGVSGTAGVLTLRDGANPGTTETMTYTKWNSLNDSVGYVSSDGAGNFTGTTSISSFSTDKIIWGNNYSATNDGDTVQSFRFTDSAFGDDEVFMIPTASNALTLSYTGAGTLGVQGFETAFTNSNSDIDLPLSWLAEAMDNDGGTSGSVSGDYIERSSTRAYSGTYSLHMNTTGASEGIKETSLGLTSGYWYRVSGSMWVPTGSGTWKVGLPRVSDYNYSSIGGLVSTNGYANDTWLDVSNDFLCPASTVSNVFVAATAAAECNFDDYSMERIRPIYGWFKVSCGAEWAEFFVSNSSTQIEGCEDAWNEDTVTNVTATADGTIFHEGTNSAKFAIGADHTTGIIGYETIAVDMTLPDAMSLWLYPTVDVAAGVIKLQIDNSAKCASPMYDLYLPALTANTWNEVKTSMLLAGSYTTPPNPAISIGLYLRTDLGAFDLYVDDVRTWNYGTVTLWSNSANVSASDTDANLCIYDRRKFITPAIKNRTGAAAQILVTGEYRYYE
jgi:hypothetical protein